MDTNGFLAVLGVALISALCGVFLKESRLPTGALVLSAAAGCLIFLRLLPALRQLTGEFADFAQLAGAEEGYLSLLLRVIGLAYLGEFSAQLCRDAGANGAALKIELAAKLCILCLALPLVAALAAAIVGLLG